MMSGCPISDRKSGLASVVRYGVGLRNVIYSHVLSEKGIVERLKEMSVWSGSSHGLSLVVNRTPMVIFDQALLQLSS